MSPVCGVQNGPGHIFISKITDNRHDLELAITSNPLHLFTCVERGKHKVDLQQQLITDISHDRELFLTLRQRHRECKGLLRLYWSLRTVHSIHFMKASPIANQTILEKTSE